MPTKSSQPVHVAGRVNRFSYAIRNIVAEAKAVEARGQRVRYLNIGDPVAFGFETPAHLVETVARAMRDGHNGYVPSAGIPQAREAVAADYAARGIAVSSDRVLITTGTSEGIELALNALVDEGDEVLVPSPTYPLYTAVLAKISAQPRYYRTDSRHDWLPDLDHLATLVTPRTRALVVIDPNNPTGAVYPAPVRRALIEFAERHDLTILADEVYGDLAYNGAFDHFFSHNTERNVGALLTANKQATSKLLLNANAGVNKRDAIYSSNEQSTDGILVAGIYNVSNAAITPTLTQYDERRQINSVYGSASFTWDGWWTVEGTARNDWSSTLPKGKNSYFYPSVNTSMVHVPPHAAGLAIAPDRISGPSNHIRIS